MWIETKYYLVIENKLSDLGLENLENEELTADFAFDTKNVESFRKLIAEDDTQIEDEVFVHFKSGLGIILEMSYDSLLKAIIKEDVS